MLKKNTRFHVGTAAAKLNTMPHYYAGNRHPHHDIQIRITLAVCLSVCPEYTYSLAFVNSLSKINSIFLKNQFHLCLIPLWTLMTKLLFSPYHFIYNLHITLNNFYYFCRHIFFQIISDRSTVITALIHFDSCVHSL